MENVSTAILWFIGIIGGIFILLYLFILARIILPILFLLALYGGGIYLIFGVGSFFGAIGIILIIVGIFGTIGYWDELKSERDWEMLNPFNWFK